MKNKIIPIEVTEYEDYLSKMTHLANQGIKHKRVSYAWYIEGPEKNILVDTGGKAETYKNYAISANQIYEPEEALQERAALSAEDIDTVILTHAHFDHIEYAESYPNAEFIIQKRELEAGRNPHPLSFPFYKDTQHLLLDNNINFTTVEGNAKIAEGIEVLKTTGHSEGGQSVVVQTEEGKAIITGFCCVWGNFNPPGELRDIMPIVPPAIHIDIKAVYESMKKVMEFGDIIVPNHDYKYVNMEEIPGCGDEKSK